MCKIKTLGNNYQLLYCFTRLKQLHAIWFSLLTFHKYLSPRHWPRSENIHSSSTKVCNYMLMNSKRFLNQWELRTLRQQRHMHFHSQKPCQPAHTIPNWGANTSQMFVLLRSLSPNLFFNFSRLYDTLSLQSTLSLESQPGTLWGETNGKWHTCRRQVQVNWPEVT